MECNQAVTRRTWAERSIALLWAAMGTIIAIPSALYLLLPRGQSRRQPAALGELGAFAVGEPRRVVYQRTRRDDWRVAREQAAAWVVRTGQEQAVAFAPECTHLGCAVNWDGQQGRFLCPCHDSAFDREGRVLYGPARRPLDRLDVIVQDGKLFVANGPSRS